jgi:hypothetical protein
MTYTISSLPRLQKRLPKVGSAHELAECVIYRRLRVKPHREVKSRDTPGVFNDRQTPFAETAANKQELAVTGLEVEGPAARKGR